MSEHSNPDRESILELLGRRDFRGVLVALKKGADCVTTDKDGNSPLHVAVRERAGKAVLEQLLANGADLQLKNNFGEPPLHLCPGAHPETAKVLLDAGADMDVRDNKGQSWLFYLAGSQCSWEDLDRIAALGPTRDLRDPRDPRGLRNLRNLRDYRGRTLLHQAISSNSSPAKLSYIINKLGIGIDLADSNGNTIFHELVLHDSSEILSNILRLKPTPKLDPDVQNKHGDTVLHLLCAPASRVRHSDYLGTVIGLSKDLEALNKAQATPLKLAAAHSERLVLELLKAGADPTFSDGDGLSPLHVAARNCQSNVVGILLGSISKLSADDCHLYRSFVDSRDRDGRTPLHYACRSGRYETVYLLIDAGADPRKCDGAGNTALGACMEFESQDRIARKQAAAERRRRYEERLANAAQNGPDCLYAPDGDASIANATTTRLENILEVVSRQVMSPNSPAVRTMFGERFQSSIHLAEKNHESYTLYCLDQVWERLQGDANSLEKQIHTLTPRRPCEGSRKYQRELDIELAEQMKSVVPGKPNDAILEQLLLKRQYAGVEKLFHSGARFLQSECGGDTNLHVLAKNGYSELLAKVGLLEAEAQFNRGRWHAAGDPNTAGLGQRCMATDTTDTTQGSFEEEPSSPQDPLLIVACRRELSNLEVLRVLVEQLRVDVNEATNSKYDSIRDVQVPGGVTAIHELAQGNHWWQVAEGLPYLLSRPGVDLEARNEDDETPLCTALRSSGPFGKHAARVLIQHGANVTRSTRFGNFYTCRVGTDSGLLRLMREHGAMVNSRDVLSTLDLQLLKDHLADGDHLNVPYAGIGVMLSDEEGKTWKTGSLPPRFSHSFIALPLLYASVMGGPSWISTDAHREIVKQQMATLLAHGASPYVVYGSPIAKSQGDAGYVIFPGSSRLSKSVNRVVSQEEEEDDDDNDDDNERDPNSVPCLHGQRTVIHALLEDGEHVAAILEQPDLDVNYRDPQGRTLLHSACRTMVGADAGLQFTYRDIAHDPYCPLPVEPFADPDAPTRITYLLDRGADALAVDDRGATALHHLLDAHDWRFSTDWRSRPPRIQRSLALLMARYPELVNRPDKAGTYPIHSALQRLLRYREQWQGEWEKEAGLEDVVDQLLGAKADSKAIDGRGNTVLHYIATGLGMRNDGDGYRNLFMYFLACGIDVNAKNYAGRTALSVFLDDDGRSTGTRDDTGRGRESTEVKIDRNVLELFESAGARFNEVDGKGRTPAHVVARRHNDEYGFRDVYRLEFLVSKNVDLHAKDIRGKTVFDYAKGGNNGSIDILQEACIYHGKNSVMS
jgi:ankyrin repeat protein